MMTRVKDVMRAAALLGLVLSPTVIGASGLGPRVTNPTFDFGTAVKGSVISHQFALVNDGATAVRIRGVAATPAIVPGRFPVTVAPGANVTIPVQIDTSAVGGGFKGVVVITLDDPRVPEVRLTVSGRVVPPIEIRPMPALFAATQRGEPHSVFVEIHNHESEPFTIEALEHPTDRFTTRLETLEPGRRYRLHLILNPDGPSGRHQENIRIRTSRAGRSTLTIPAYTNLRERVYAFPVAVDLGRLRLPEIEARPDMLAETAQTLMVYRPGRSDLEVEMRTDLPELDVRWERGPQGDRYQARVMLIKDKLRPGPIAGSIVIQTNDAEFPTLTVPVSGAILSK